MIFVTVGLHEQEFVRLVRAADELAALVEESVLIQRGNTRFTPQSAQYFDFADEATVQEWLSEARVVVSHGGAGSILNALQAGKPLVVAPRLKRFREHIDDHQLELAQALVQYGRAVAVTEPSAEALQQAVEQAAELAGETHVGSRLQETLRDWLDKQTVDTMPRRWRLLCRRHSGDSR
jgi:UDP-N-acetylglucosamine transferase subunit ALG13